MSLPELFGILTDIATLIAIPVSILIFTNEKRRERLEREYGTFDALDEKYAEFLKLCIEMPELDLYDIPLGKEVHLTKKQKIQQYALFEILVSLFERAYLMYYDQSKKIRQQQWGGWSQYIVDFAQRDIFQQLWGERGYGYDEGFIAYVNAVIDSDQK